MELVIAFAATVLFVYSAKWRKFVIVSALVAAISLTALCSIAYIASRHKTVDDILGPAPAADSAKH